MGRWSHLRLARQRQGRIFDSSNSNPGAGGVSRPSVPTSSSRLRCLPPR